MLTQPACFVSSMCLLPLLLLKWNFLLINILVQSTFLRYLWSQLTMQCLQLRINVEKMFSHFCHFQAKCISAKNGTFCINKSGNTKGSRIWDNNIKKSLQGLMSRPAWGWTFLYLLSFKKCLECSKCQSIF